MNSLNKSYVNSACQQNESVTTLQPSFGEQLVGWLTSGTPRCGTVYRAAVWFRDIPMKVTVEQAILTFYVSRSSSSSQGHPLSGNVSCAAQLQVASAMWMNNPNSPTALFGTPYQTFPADQPGDTERLGPFSISNGMFVAIDVTQAVQQWSNGARPNYGFVLVPDHADFSATQGRCMSLYRGFTLTVDSK